MACLVERLRQYQEEHELTDAEMGVLLGVTRTAWQHVRAGRRGPGVRMVRGVMAGLPALTEDALSFLRGDATIVSDQNTIVDIEPECPGSAQDGQQTDSRSQGDS